MPNYRGGRGYGPEDILFDNASEFLTGASYHFMHELISKLDPEGPMAHYVCEVFESDSPIKAINAIFPKAFHEHEKKKNAVRKELEPLKKELTALGKKMNEAKATLKPVTSKAKGNKEKHDEFMAMNDQYQELSRKISDYQLLDTDYKPVYTHKAREAGQKVNQEDWKGLQKWFLNKSKALMKSDPDPVYENLAFLGEHLGLNEKERRILQVLLCYQNNEPFKTTINYLSVNSTKGYYYILGQMIGGAKIEEVGKILSKSSRLFMNGFLHRDDGMDPEDEDDDADYRHDAYLTDLPFIPDHMVSILSEPGVTIQDILKRLIGDPVTTHLDWDKDFAHLGENAKINEAILRGALKKGQMGLNYLFYGLPDTGKTEAVKALCKKLGLTLYAIGESNGDKKEPSRQERLGAMVMAQSLLADKKNVAVLFDEMEDALPGNSMDIFGQRRSAGASKVFLNRLLEQNKIPTFWTANDQDSFHPAIRRRMTFSIEFGVPPVPVRENLWNAIAKLENFDLKPEDAKLLAENYKAPPGMIRSAIRNAIHSGGDLDVIRRSMNNSAQLLYGSPTAIANPYSSAGNYDLSLLNASLDGSSGSMISLAENLVLSRHKDARILMYGPPGTGKSAFARYLCDKMGMEIKLIKASDLFNKYHGESERLIARAFAEAREAKQFLVFDEGDSFLRDRNGVANSWEVPIINEFLAQMENHTQPMVCTTNLVDKLDEASKRRFDFKIKVAYMNPEQINRAFKLYFNASTPQFVEALSKLTPGDFANVKRQIQFTQRTDPDYIGQLLSKEVEIKNDSGSLYSGSGNCGFITPGYSTGISTENTMERLVTLDLDKKPT